MAPWSHGLDAGCAARRGGVQTWKLLDGGHLLSAAREWLRGSLVAANAARAFASRRSTRSSSVFAAMMQRLGSQLDSLPRNIARACRRRLRGSDLRLHVRVRARRRYRVLAPLVWALTCGASSLVVVVRFVQETMCAIVALAIVDAEHDAADAVGNAIRWWHDVQGRCVFTCLPLSPVVLALCSRWLRGCLLMLLYAVRVCCVCVCCVCCVYVCMLFYAVPYAACLTGGIEPMATKTALNPRHVPLQWCLGVWHAACRGWWCIQLQ